METNPEAGGIQEDYQEFKKFDGEYLRTEQYAFVRWKTTRRGTKIVQQCHAAQSAINFFQAELFIPVKNYLTNVEIVSDVAMFMLIAMNENDIWDAMEKCLV